MSEGGTEMTGQRERSEKELIKYAKALLESNNNFGDYTIVSEEGKEIKVLSSMLFERLVT